MVRPPGTLLQRSGGYGESHLRVQPVAYRAISWIDDPQCVPMRCEVELVAEGKVGEVGGSEVVNRLVSLSEGGEISWILAICSSFDGNDASLSCLKHRKGASALESQLMLFCGRW